MDSKKSALKTEKSISITANEHLPVRPPWGSRKAKFVSLNTVNLKGSGRLVVRKVPYDHTPIHHTKYISSLWTNKSTNLEDMRMFRMNDQDESSLPELFLAITQHTKHWADCTAF